MSIKAPLFKELNPLCKTFLLQEYRDLHAKACIFLDLANEECTPRSIVKRDRMKAKSLLMRIIQIFNFKFREDIESGNQIMNQAKAAIHFLLADLVAPRNASDEYEQVVECLKRLDAMAIIG